jgi:hypothetical protein
VLSCYLTVLFLLQEAHCKKLGLPMRARPINTLASIPPDRNTLAPIQPGPNMNLGNRFQPLAASLPNYEEPLVQDEELVDSKGSKSGKKSPTHRRCLKRKKGQKNSTASQGQEDIDAIIQSVQGANNDQEGWDEESLFNISEMPGTSTSPTITIAHPMLSPMETTLGAALHHVVNSVSDMAKKLTAGKVPSAGRGGGLRSHPPNDNLGTFTSQLPSKGGSTYVRYPFPTSFARVYV